MKKQLTSLSLRLICVLALAGVSACGGGFSTVPGSPAARTGAQAIRVAHVVPSTTKLVDWDSFGYDLQRTGYNPKETVVGTGNVGSLQQLWPATVNVGDDPVWEPVLASGVTIAGTSTNVFYAGSSAGSTLYAINADTGAIIWTHKVPYLKCDCNGSEVQYSIMAAPAIDRTKGLIYIGDGHNQVHALSLATGKQAKGWPISIAPYSGSQTSGDHNQMHGGLTYNPANGMLYAVTSSPGDITPWHGRIVAIDTKTASIAGTFFPVSGTSTQGGSGGGIWAPGGASIDATTNNVFIATGNADTTTGIAQNAGYAEEVVELSPDVNTIVASNYPTNIPIIAGDDDFDFGSTPLLFDPPGCPPLVAAENKSGMLELYDRATISEGPVQYIQMSFATSKGDFIDTPAYDPVTHYVYVGMPATFGSYVPGLAAFSIESNCTLDPTPVWSAMFGPDGAKASKGEPRSPLTIANGVIYVSNHTGDTEFAFDAATGAQLWSVGLTNSGVPGTVVANGIVYVTANDGTITAWAPPPSAAAHQLQQAERFMP
jgi:outer membrane protein assembly factor BamB